jgi:hypothetical protein
MDFSTELVAEKTDMITTVENNPEGTANTAQMLPRTVQIKIGMSLTLLSFWLIIDCVNSEIRFERRHSYQLIVAYFDYSQSACMRIIPSN